ncbi:MAG: 5-amino-6-(D-ribitylamino)uracil--L-tyrosine 4-hydroxyphenyl transferase CofH, partial [Pseudomonadota bacterium]|nr:5-amino-6-(D-ribitylamino)uracil--L-tyrosine 4-hydroxyphenyl transferase CofH [Pseudomonadota bacterium]
KLILAKASAGEKLQENEIVRLLQARGDDFTHVCQAADQVRRSLCGDEVTYCVNRNINYTNVCYFKCQFCAFSKGKMSENLRGRPYDLSPEELMRRTREAYDRGASEVCLQGGIHPEYTGQTYIDICHSIKQVVPDMHIHAFSPLEVWQGAQTLNLPIGEFLKQLKEAGLDTLPGTAAEILDDEVRATLCPDKINTSQWLEVMEAAHTEGFNTTATIMYGHIEGYHHVARHLLRVRRLQERTQGFTEFVILPFIHMEAPLYLKGHARKGPTFREAVLIHAVSRLALNPVFKNIQASWTKLGHQGVKACLQAGVNDLGGTLMNETITRAAGASHGQETAPETMEELIVASGRTPRQRTTTYGEVSELQK